MLPPTAKLMAPVSSEQMTAMASVSSVMPMPARWRVPSCVESRGFIDKRKETGGSSNAILLHDYGAIVKGSAGTEDCSEQIVGKPGIQWNAAFDVGAQTDFTLDHDQGAGLVLREEIGGEHDVVVGIVVARRSAEKGKRRPRSART